MDDDSLRQSVGKGANQYMREIWNADLASERFITLAEKMLIGEKEYNIFLTDLVLFA